MAYHAIVVVREGRLKTAAVWRLILLCIVMVLGRDKVCLFVGLSALMPRRRTVLLPERVPSFISRGAPHQAA
jgi:hypothetical protein